MQQNKTKQSPSQIHASILRNSQVNVVYNQLSISAPIGMNSLAIQVRSFKMPQSNCY